MKGFIVFSISNNGFFWIFLRFRVEIATHWHLSRREARVGGEVAYTHLASEARVNSAPKRP